MPEHDHRGLGQPEMGRRQDATVASDQLAIGGHQNRHCLTKFGHAGGDLQDLIGVVGLGVPGVRFQLGDGSMFDLVG